MIAQTLLGITLGVVSAIHLVGCVKDNKTVIRVTKPFLVPLVILIMVASTSSINWLVVVGLLFGLGGDICLIFREETPKAFLAGLLSFMLGHVVYIIAFSLGTGFFEAIQWWSLLFMIPYLLVALFLHKSLKDHMGKMKVPAMVYMGVILTMSVFALLRAFSANPLTFWFVFTGSVLFVVSDTILAFEHFKNMSVYNHAAVMATYITAQLLIALGYVFVA